MNILEKPQGLLQSSNGVARVAHPEFGEGVGLSTTTTYTYATGTAAYLNPHAVATTTAASTTSFTYDNNGNLTSTKIGTTTLASYTWDYNNNLTQVVGSSATSTYSYDPSGQRVKQTVATGTSVTTYYPSKGYNITGSTPTKNIFLPDGTLIATVIGTGATTTVSYIHIDHLGGMNVATDDGGDVVELTDYYPYGGKRIDQQDGLNSQRQFANYEFDNSTGLNYLNQRYLNTSNARFLSQDPAFLAMGDEGQIRELTRRKLQQLLSDPQALNSYSYSRNNPLRYYDPDGQWFEEALSWINGRTGIGQTVDNSATYNYMVEHPVQGGIAVGLGSGALLAGGSALLSAGYTGLGIGGETAATLGTAGSGACASGVCEKVADEAPKVARGLQLGQKIDGVGTVIENAAGKIAGFNHNGSFHGLDQIISRGVTPNMLYNTVQNPLQRFAQPGNRVLYLGQQTAVVLDKANQVVTSFTSNEYYSKYVNLVNQIIGGK